MSPRFLGCRAVLVRSFARIHETNLKAQGILPLTFADPASYDLIGESDRISLSGVSQIKPGSEITVTVQPYKDGKPDGVAKSFKAKQTFTPEQLEWFKAGSGLNVLRKN